MPRRSLLWPDPRVKPPYGSVEMDRGHPLARGLRAMLLVNEGTNTPQWLGVRPGAPTIAGGPSHTGQGVVFNGSSGVVWWDGCPFSSSGAPPLASAFLRWRGWTSFVSDNVFATFGGYSAATDPLWIVKQGGADSNQITVVYRDDNGASYDATTTGLTLRNGAPHSVVSVLAGAGAAGHTIYVDGVAFSASTAGALGVTVDRLALGAQRRATTSFYSAVTIELLYLYLVSLTASEAGWLTAEPYAMLRPIVRRRYFVPAAGAKSLPLFADPMAALLVR